MKKLLSILAIAFFLTGCGSSGEETNAATGHVSGTDGIATSIGAGATVDLIQIDIQGNQVGNVIATTSTDAGGDYTLNVSTDHSPSTSYIVKATAGSSSISAIWTSYTTDISVITDAAVTLLFNSSNASTSSLAAAASTPSVNIAEVENTIEIVSEMSENGTDKVLNVQENQEALDQVDSSWGAYVIKGRVTDSTGTPIKGIKVFARDFNNREKRSSIKTDANGDYEMNIQLKTGYGDQMIVGIMNRTTISTAASEFYKADASPSTASGTKCHQPQCSDPVTISETTPQVLDFQLAAGARITGTITGGSNNTALKRVKVTFRDALSRKFRGAVKSDDNGVFNFNIAPGEYIAYFLNGTESQQYGSKAWTSNGGHVDRNYGDIFTAPKTINMNLDEGGTIQGVVCDAMVNPTCSASETHQRKKIKIRQFSKTDRFNNNIDFDLDTARSNTKSKYRIQVPYGKYRIVGHGKDYDNDGDYYTIDASNRTLDLNIDHATKIAGILVTDLNDKPVSDIIVKLTNYVTGTKIGTSTFSDGTAQVGVDVSSDSRFYYSLSSREGHLVAACNYDGTICSSRALSGKKLGNADSTGKARNDDIIEYTRDIVTDPGVLTLKMPVGVPITGTVTGTDGNVSANASVSLSVEDTLKDDNPGWRTLTSSSTGSDGKYAISLSPGIPYIFGSKLDNDTRIEFRGPDEVGCSVSAANTIDFDYSAASSTGRYRFNDCEFETPAMPHTIDGTVKGVDGAELAKALVRIDIYENVNSDEDATNDILFRRIEAITDDNGYYSITVPEDAAYYYKFRAYYTHAYGVTDFWSTAKFIEYGRDTYKNTETEHCVIDDDITIDFDGTSLDGLNNSKNASCLNAP